MVIWKREVLPFKMHFNKVEVKKKKDTKKRLMDESVVHFFFSFFFVCGLGNILGKQKP